MSKSPYSIPLPSKQKAFIISSMSSNIPASITKGEKNFESMIANFKAYLAESYYNTLSNLNINKYF